MLFRRRKPAPFSARLREFLWPRKGFSRPWRYVGKRILRIRATTHAIALGVAIGVFAAFTPFLGLHIVIALAIAYLLSGNLVAAALGTTLANPLTLPVIWGATYRLGNLMLGRGMPEDAGTLFRMVEHFEFLRLWQPVLKPMLVGSVVIGGIAAVIAYLATWWAVRLFHSRRLARLAARLTDMEDMEASREPLHKSLHPGA